MSVLVKQVEDKLCELVRDAAKKAMAAGELPEAELTDFKVEIPADRKNGDYSTNAAMAWARAFRRAPAMIAAAITKNIDLEGTAFSSCEAAGPGFINFRLADRFYSEILMDIRKGQRLRPLRLRQGRKGKYRVRLRQSDRTDAHGQCPRRRSG